MFVSGQIGLIPKNMSMPTPPNVAFELVLSLQHAERIATLTMDTLGTSLRSQRNDSVILWMTKASAIRKVCDAWLAVIQVRLWPDLFLEFVTFFRTTCRQIRLAVRLASLLEQRSCLEAHRSKLSCFTIQVLSSRWRKRTIAI